MASFEMVTHSDLIVIDLNQGTCSTYLTNLSKNRGSLSPHFSI